MTELADRVAFVRGLAEGLQVEPSSPETKVLYALLDALAAMSEEIVALRASQEELDAYVESIDNDLSSLEETLDGAMDETDDADDDAEDDAVDDDNEESCVVCACPECRKAFLVTAEELVAHTHFECPHCGARTPATPANKGIVPIAKPLD